MEYAITDKKLIFLYFQSLQEPGLSSVIDFGMFLKRMGALSRTALDLTISKNLPLTGVDASGSPSFPLYERLYERIVPSLPAPEEHFSLGFVLSPNAVFSEEKQRQVFLWCASWCDKTVTDVMPKESILSAFGKKEEILYEGKRYLALYKKEGR